MINRGEGARGNRPTVRPRFGDLLSTSAFAWTGAAPAFLRHVSEGDVSAYGPLLQATGDAELRDYLERSAVDGLWEFNAGSGATAADSALVLEGLQVAGADPALLRHAAARLVACCYVEEAGGFRAGAVSGDAERAGVVAETTAQLAWLLHRIDPSAWRDLVQRCAQFVRRSQQGDGHWEGEWWQSHRVATYYAVRLLRYVDLEHAAQRLVKTREWLLRTQQRNGSWSDLVIETSAAILALQETGGGERAIEMARDWLQARVRAGAVAGEPVHGYLRGENDRREFCLARDAQGRLARAWATLAVRTR